jgi:hypothetical protein
MSNVQQLHDRISNLEKEVFGEKKAPAPPAPAPPAPAPAPARVSDED